MATLATALRAVPDLGAELDTTLCRLDKMGSDPGRCAETPMVWRHKASEAKWVLHNVLGTWVRDLWTTWGDGPLLLADDTAEFSRWLLRHPSWIAQHPAVDELADEVHDAIRLAWRAIDRTKDTRVFLGRCDLGLAENPVCAEELYAHPSQEDVTCPCGAEWSVSERRNWLVGEMRERDEVGTATELAGLMGILGLAFTVRDIHRAARSRLLLAEAIDSHSHRRRYRISAVLAALIPNTP